MMRALYTGASGVKSHQTKMDAIGNNISNVNTVGFKSTRVTFADMLSQNLKGATSGGRNVGGTNAKQIGLGSYVSATDLMFRDGAPLSTGKNTDLAISGDGLFVVQRNGQTYYTRNGAFEFDAAGNYVLPGSGHFVQGWTATNGVIDTAGAVGDIKVTKGQEMPAAATGNVDYYYNLNADIPMVTGISGGEDVVTSVITVEDVSEVEPLPVTFGGKVFYVSGISDNLDPQKTWTNVDDIPLGATEANFTDEDGKVINCKLSPPANFEVPKGTTLGIGLGYYTKGSVTEEYPLLAKIDSDQYTVVGIDKNLYFKDWVVKAGSAPAGSSTITINSTDGDEVVLTLDKPLETGIAEGKKITIETKERVATAQNPMTLTLSDGTTRLVTDGSYKIGNSLPITTTATVYDSLGNTHQIPIYFVREGELNGDVVNSTNKWLVSLSPDSDIAKGDATTAEFTDANGNTITASLNAAEIQFDSSGKLVTSSEGETAPDITGLLTLTIPPSAVEPTAEGATPTAPTAQNVTLDFSELTQYAGSTTVNTESDGNTAGVLKEIQIDNSGIITGIYTNNVRRPEAQVAVAHFTNSPGLFKTGTSLYIESENSGIPVINSADNFGVTITAGAIEMSNVDVANEFAEMIITQRGFQSNTKIVTVSDEMIETAVNMKR